MITDMFVPYNPQGPNHTHLLDLSFFRKSRLEIHMSQKPKWITNSMA
ncbi:hypothetical protein SAMN05216204_1421 [Massilia yuzhufengensis]|uniref:Uncharacterized protein n=1 Tax=Massilia yuzhufengensis TaxID=1164594 RepID=A0A1I1VST4_9BURK|nr:hypothetical protein SAMN05216204_1421 [Massilia yuzhufengensis]